MGPALFDVVVIEQLFDLPVLAILNDAIPAGGVVIRFDDDGDVVSAAATVARFEFVVPLLPGMSELVVERAQLEVRGRRVDQAAVMRAKASSSATLDLEGRPGGLRRIDLRGIAVQPGAPEDVRLTASTGSPAAFRWRREGEHVTFSRTAGGKQLHLMIRPHDGEAFGPPQTAVPHYAMPDNASGLYGPVLAGASLTLDDPVAGAARLTLDPPVQSERVQLFLGTNDEEQEHAGLPHEASAVPWTATEVGAVWATAPTDVELRATAGGLDPVQVASLPGEMSTAPAAVDFTPAARALLTQAYAASATEDLVLAIEPSSSTAGELVGTSLLLTAHYRLDSVGGEGLPVRLRGTPETVAVPIAPGLTPAQLALTVDGSFGPAVRVAASDGDRPGRRTGLRLAGAARGARRVTLTAAERTRPLTRIAVYGRADEPTEVLLALVTDQNGRMGPPLGEPVAVRLEAALEPAWHRADLAAPTQPAGSDALWVVAQVSTGRFWWFADPAEPAVAGGPGAAAASGAPGAAGDLPGPARPAMSSPDGGATWSSVAARPVVQVHYVAERPEPAPLSLRGPAGPLAADVLALPAARSRVETTLLDALQRGLAGDGSPPPTVGRPSASVTFRKEAVRPVADLSSLADLGEHLTLNFDCERDADFRVLDAVLTYDPWAAR